jgi:hypothetical protein
MKKYQGCHHKGGYVGILALLISVTVLSFIMYKYFDPNPETGKSSMDTNRAAIDSSKEIKAQAEVRAKAANQMMEGM